MNSEIEALEAKVEQVVALVAQLRADNDQLKARVAAVETEKLRLQQTMTAARERLEGLMEKLPEDV